MRNSTEKDGLSDSQVHWIVAPQRASNRFTDYTDEIVFVARGVVGATIVKAMV